MLIWTTHVRLDPGVGAAPRAGRVWPALSGDPDTAPPSPRLLEGAASGRRGSGSGGVLESPAVEGRCGRLPHKGGGGGGKAGRGGPGAGEAGRGGGGGGGGDKAPAQPGRLVLWLHGSAGCTRPRRLSPPYPRRCAVLPPGSDRHLGIQARTGEYRLRGPRRWEGSRGPSPGLRRNRAPGRELSRAAGATAASAPGSRVPYPRGLGRPGVPEIEGAARRARRGCGGSWRAANRDPEPEASGHSGITDPALCLCAPGTGTRRPTLTGYLCLSSVEVSSDLGERFSSHWPLQQAYPYYAVAALCYILFISINCRPGYYEAAE